MAAEIKIHLRFNKDSGKKDILIEYDSEDDALPYEHEQRHRQIVEQLIGQGLVGEDDVGNILVGRIEKDKDGKPVVTQEPTRPQKEKAGQG